MHSQLLPNGLAMLGIGKKVPHALRSFALIRNGPRPRPAQSVASGVIALAFAVAIQAVVLAILLGRHDEVEALGVGALVLELAYALGVTALVMFKKQ